MAVTKYGPESSITIETEAQRNSGILDFSISLWQGQLSFQLSLMSLRCRNRAYTGAINHPSQWNLAIWAGAQGQSSF